MANYHEIQVRAASTLVRSEPDELTADMLYSDLRVLGYQLPLQSKGDARHVVMSLSDVVVRERLATSFIPGSRTHWSLRMASSMADAALLQDDILTAYSSASFYDSIHPLNRLTGWEHAQSQILWAGYISVMPEVGIDVSDYM
jgi:hypothetical protein